MSFSPPPFECLRISWSWQRHNKWRKNSNIFSSFNVTDLVLTLYSVLEVPRVPRYMCKTLLHFLQHVTDWVYQIISLLFFLFYQSSVFITFSDDDGMRSRFFFPFFYLQTTHMPWEIFEFVKLAPKNGPNGPEQLSNQSG